MAVAKEELLTKMVIFNEGALEISFAWHNKFKPAMQLLNLKKKGEGNI